MEYDHDDVHRVAIEEIGRFPANGSRDELAIWQQHYLAAVDACETAIELLRWMRRTCFLCDSRKDLERVEGEPRMICRECWDRLDSEDW